MQWARSGGCNALPSKVCKMAGWERRTDRKSQRHPERGEFEAADDDGKLAMILDGAWKERGVGMVIRKMWKKRFVWRSTILNFFCVCFSWTVPHGEQSLVLVLYIARLHSNMYNNHNHNHYHNNHKNNNTYLYLYWPQPELAMWTPFRGWASRK